MKFGFPDFSKDKKAFMVEVETGGVPKRGSSELILKGELQVSVASKSKLEKSKAVAAKKGSKLKVGEREFEVSKAGKPDWGDAKFSITLKSSFNDKDFKAFEFFTADGKKIKAERRGHSSMGMFGKRTYEVTYNLDEKVNQFVLGIDVWTDLEKIKVPFDLKVKAGL